jgi:hypothetical protein
VLQQTARLAGVGGVQGFRTSVNVADYSLAVNHEGDAVGKKMRKVENVVSPGSGLFGVAEQWERRADFLGKLPVPFPAVKADANNLGARSAESGDITLIRLQLLRSTRS